MGPDAMILVFWMLNFKPAFSLCFFTFIKRLCSSSSLSAIRVVSSAYLRLLIFLLAIMIPASVSSSPAFLMMYSACKLNKQGDDIQPSCTHFPIWNQSVVPCPVLTVAFDLHTDFQEAGQGFWHSHFFKNFTKFAVIHTVKDFRVINEAGEVFWNSLAFSMIQFILAIVSLVRVPFQNPVWISGSSWFRYGWNIACRTLSIALLVCEINAIVQ